MRYGKAFSGILSLIVISFIAIVIFYSSGTGTASQQDSAAVNSRLQPTLPPPLATNSPYEDDLDKMELVVSVPEATIPPRKIPPPAPTPKPDDPYNLTISYQRETSLNILIPESSIIALGTVTEIQDPRWNTKDGKRPSNPFESKNIIFRPVILQVEEYIKGGIGEEYLTIFAVGGTIGLDSVIVDSDEYGFTVGEKALLILSKNRQTVSSVGETLSVYDKYAEVNNGQYSNNIQIFDLIGFREKVQEILAIDQ